MRDSRRLYAVRSSQSGSREVLSHSSIYRGGALVEWASLTKPVTARLASVLAEEGQLPLSTPVSDLVPELTGLNATLQDLIFHRSGLPHIHPGARSWLLHDPYGEVDASTLLTSLTALDRPVSPSGFAYSNVGYALLGIAIERAMATDWFTLVRDFVLLPHRYPTVTVTPESGQPLASRLLGLPRRPWAISTSAYRPAGGLWSTTDDLVRFAEDSLELESRIGWFVLRRGVVYHTGQGRDSGSCIVVDFERRVSGTAHAMLRGPNATKEYLVKALWSDIAKDASNPSRRRMRRAPQDP
ncbi:serine hydrolase domain-containing protein [Corynebacterium auris]|uniref:serine hydrolase domain-containing protein n=1 Tax=Corynebacterium auris TaxID=44750 RepID=UPI00338D5476|nr:Penicillin-binding protein 4* [Corynebacterium auris]